jgi:hypothetical protein
MGAIVASYQVDLLCLTETNISWEARDVKHKVLQHLRKHWRKSKVATSSSSWVFPESSYQPGGTLTLVGNPWATRASTNGDTSGMGRWSEVCITGKKNKVTFITAYRVVQKKGGVQGFKTAFLQQCSILRTRGKSDDELDPRKLILEDLGKRIKALKEENHEIILSIDANDTLQNISSEFTKFALQHGLSDILVDRHGTDGEPATYARGTRRIDYVMATQAINEYVKAAGIMPLKTFSDSDHRPNFVDIDLVKFLENEPTQSGITAPRSVGSDQPRAVLKYRKELTKYLDSTNFEEETYSAIEDMKDPSKRTAAEAKIRGLQKSLVDKRLQIEQGCAKLDNSPWSPQLRDAVKRKTYFRIWVSEYKLGKDFSEQRRKIWDVDEEIKPKTLKEAEKLLKEAIDQVKEVLSHARDIRTAHLVERANAAAAEGRPADKKAILALIKSEKNRKIYVRLKRLLGKANNGGLTHIINEKEELVLDPAEMYTQLLERNAAHFSQADGTPFTRPAMTDLFGKYGTNKMSKLLLDGGMDLENQSIPDAWRAILLQLKRLTPEGSIPYHISGKDVENINRKWRESTSTSPSGLHLGHQKALLRFENRHDKDEGKLSTRMFNLTAAYLNVAIEYGIVYERWETVINALIEKIPGVPLIHKLRVIHLIESDFNLLIGILFGRRMMQKGEELGAFGHDQDGCRSDRKSTDTLLDKLLRYSVGRLTLTDYATFDNDAKSCFDRIVMLPASLIAQRLGMDPKVCKLFIKTLRTVRYYVKTQMGISDGFYSTTETSTIHGPGQGGRGSPAIWVAECCLAMECMAERSNGMTILDPHNEITTNKIMSGFVDDTTHWINNFQESLAEVEHLSDLITQTKITAQWWEELLNTLGGKLELPKCFFYLVHWIFNDEGEPTIINPILLPSTIEIVDSADGSTSTIATKSSYESHKTLGVMMNPAGDQNDEIKRLNEKSKKFAQRISLAVLSKLEATMLYEHYFVPSIGYGLSVGTLNLTQAAKIQSKPLQTLLPKMGYNQKTAGAVVFGPKSMGGAGLRHIYAEQGTQKAQIIIQQLRTQRPLGKLLATQLRWAQRVAGIHEPILIDTKTRIPQLDNELWLTTLREFLQASNLGIETPMVKGIKTARKGDMAIMEIVERPRGKQRYADADVRKINRCRIFLRAELLSEICNAAGTHVRLECVEMTQEGRCSTDELWPRQPRPGPAHRRVWKRFLRDVSNDNRSLLIPLQEWTGTTASNWNAYYDSTRHKAITSDDQRTWSEWNLEPTRRGWAMSGKTDTHAPQRNSTLIPASMEKVRGKPALQWYKSEQATAANPEVIAQQTPDKSQWDGILESIPQWERHIIEGYKLSGTEQQALIEKLENPKECIMIVSDGGVKDGMGSFGWVLAAEGEPILVKGSGQVWGNPMTSYRAEAFGKLAWICFLNRFIQLTKVKVNCMIKTYCDNESVIKHTRFEKRHTSSGSTLRADWDVLRTIAIEQAKLRIEAEQLKEGVHVKGHQDATKTKEPLSEQAHLNILADKIASQALAEIIELGRSPTTTRFDECKAYLISEGGIVTSNEKRTLQWSWTGLRLQHYYMKHYGKEEDTIRSINWAGMAIARRKLSQSERVFSTKLCTDHLATGSRLELYGYAVTHCHMCKGTETVDHLFNCGCKNEYKRLFVYTLEQQLEKIGTIPALSTAMVAGVAAWLNGADVEHIANDTETISEVRNCLLAQNKIGWNLVMRGLIANEWAAVQESFYNKANETDRILGDSWSSKVSLWLTREARKLWLDRNEALYEPESGKESRLDQETRANVRDLYAAEMKMSESDRWIFGTPLHTMLNRPTIYQAQWVAKYTALIIQCVQEFETREENHMADLRDYYEPKPRGAPSPMRCPLRTQQKRSKNLKPVSLVQFFQSSISPGERTKRAARAKIATDERKEQEKRRKAKQKTAGQTKLQNFFQQKENAIQTGQRNGEVALS